MRKVICKTAGGGRVTLDLKAAGVVIKRLGLDERGNAQAFHTQNCVNRITKYMPMDTGALIKITQAQTVIRRPEIVTRAPQARYLFYGKAMVDSQTGKGPACIPGVGYRWRKGASLKATSRDLTYDRSKNPMAGPRWDKALSAREGKALAADLQRYLRQGGK